MATTLGDGFKNLFLANVGAMAIAGEKTKEVVDKLVEAGEATVEQGKDLNSELKHRAGEATEKVRDDSLEAYMAAMTPEQRAEFAAKAAEVAAKENAKDASKSEGASSGASASDDGAKGKDEEEATVIEVEEVDEPSDGGEAGKSEN